MSYTILLVDDDKDFREEFHDCLEEYHVIEASKVCLNGAIHDLKQWDVR